MTDEEKLTVLSTRVGNPAKAELLRSYLFDAKEVILNRIYEVVERPNDAEVPARYDSLHIRIAEYLYYRRGSEGQTAHREGGIDRVYGSSSIPKEMLKEVMPLAGV